MIKLLSCAAVVPLLLSGCSPRETNSSIKSDEINSPSIESYGRDSISRDQKKLCLEPVQFVEPLGGGNLNSSTFYFDRVDDVAHLAQIAGPILQEDLKEFIGEENKLTISDFIQSSSLNPYHTTLAVHIDFYKARRLIENPTLTQAALDLLENDGVSDFRDECGDEFLSSYVVGGQFLALFEFKTTSKLDKQELDILASQLRLSINDKSRKVSEKLKERVVSIKLFQEKPTTIEVDELNTIEEAISSIQTFTNLWQKAPVLGSHIRHYEGMRYDLLLDFPFGFELPKVYDQVYNLKDMNEKRLVLEQYQSSFDYILSNPTEFEITIIEEVNAQSVEVNWN